LFTAAVRYHVGTMSLFLEFALLLVFALGVAVMMRALRQPVLVGYIIAGIIVGPVLLDLVHSRETLALLSEFGVALLLFTVGLNINPHVVRKFGLVALLAGMGQVVFTASIGFLMATWFGFANLTALYIGIALAFSSTIIILKLLGDKGELETLYGKISVGILIVQDLIAVLLLFFVPILAANGGSGRLSGTLLAGVLLLAFVLWVGIYLLPYAHRFLARSQELLYFFAIVWGIGIAALFQYVGFSLESGALVAGIALAGLPSRREISARLVPVRDFFIVLFFIYLGLQLTFGGGTMLVPAVALSLFVLIGNPLILMVIMGLLGYKKRTSFETGLTVAQISEFSLIFIALGVSLGHVHPDVLSLVTFIGILTIFGSTYFIQYSRTIFGILSPHLSIFERRKARDTKISEREPKALLIGCKRAGYDFLHHFKRDRVSVLVVDYDPEQIEALKLDGVDVEYGDAGDMEFVRELPMRSLSILVSTVSDMAINMGLLAELKKKRLKAIFIGTAESTSDALALYKAGAHHIILPNLDGARSAVSYLKEYEHDLRRYLPHKRRHISYLRSRE